MMHQIYPEFFYDRKLVDLCHDFIDEGKYDYSQLEEDDKEDLVAMLIEVMGEESYLGLVEHDYLHLIMHNIKMFLRSANQDYSKDLMAVCTKSVLEYYLPLITPLYNELGAEKLLFGSDGGIGHPAVTTAYLRRLDLLEAPPEDKEKILGTNALKLIGKSP